MELGNFLGKLKGKEKEAPIKFLALILTDEVVQAAVWHVLGEATEIVAVGTPVEWDGDTGTTSELVTAVDATISSATEGLGDEPNSVILGIPVSWTDKEGVLGVKREFISKIRKELELEAIGYVVITDSIVSYLKIQEGTPTTSILIQVSRDELTLLLVRLGRIEAIETIGRGDDIVEDVTEGIARFKLSGNLPSRIILFNSMHNLDEIIQNLLSTDWQTQFNFLHLPKIEALPKDIAIRALVVAGGSEVAKSLGIPVTQIAQQVDPSGPGPIEGKSEPNVEILSAQEIGFGVSTEPEKIDFIDPDDEPEEPVKPKRPKLTLPKIVIPKFNLRDIGSHWWYILGGLLALTGLSFYLVWILPSAVVSVRVLPKEIDDSVELTLSSAVSSLNFADHIVPASIDSLSQIGQKQIETTGTKTVGESAKGEVTIYNKTSSSKTFTQGTILSSGSLKFTLDSDVTIASTSSSTEGITFGKNTVSLTASAIGKDSNLSNGTELAIASFSKDSYVAKNDATLTGGNSEEVQVVGKDDQKTLLTDLTKELIEVMQSQSTALAEPGINVYLIADSAKVDTSTYSAKVGDTTKTLTLDLALTASLIKYQTDDVTTLVDSSLDQAVPQGYIRSSLPSAVDLSVSSVGTDGKSVKGSAKVKVSLLPVVNKEGLAKLVKGKKGTALESILSSNIPLYSSAKAIITPSWIPLRLKSLPLNPARITIEIVPAI